MAGYRNFAPLALAIVALAATIGGPATAAANGGLQVQHGSGGAPSALDLGVANDPQVSELQAEVSKLMSQMSALQAQIASLQEFAQLSPPDQVR